MRSGRRIIMTLVAILLLPAAPGIAQTDNRAELHCTPQIGVIRIDIELDIGAPLPPEWVGFGVLRRTIGICEEIVPLGGVVPFPAGPGSYALTDAAVVEGVTYHYRVMAVDADGAYHYLGSPPDFPPGYYHDDYASLGDAGAVGRGVLVAGGMGSAGIELCGGSCWEPISFISELPPDLEPGVGTGVIVVLYGTIDNEFEGPYVSSISDWAIVEDCGTVPTLATGWGSLKAHYR